jgi:hypothetical protein
MLARWASADGKACALPPWRSRAPWCQAMPDGDGILCHPAGMEAASDSAMENHRWHHLTHETSRPGAPVGDLPRIFTADTVSYRASLYGRRSLRSPKRSGPEWPAFSPGPADGMTGASARGPGSSQMTCGPAILPFLIKPRTEPPEGEPDCAFGPPFDSCEPPISRVCRTRSRRGWQSLRHAGVGGRDEPPVRYRVLRRRPLPSYLK